MKTKIKSVTVVSQQRTRFYEVGSTWNGLRINNISDHSQEFPDGWNNCYCGYTEDNQVVFQVVNCPTDAQYKPMEDIPF